MSQTYFKSIIALPAKSSFKTPYPNKILEIGFNKIGFINLSSKQNTSKTGFGKV
jgi:hypothetical protein